MAERTPPIWLQGGSHSAENMRNLTALLLSTSGIIAATDMAVTAPGGTMTVSVAAGDVLLKGSRSRQGVYHLINDAPVSKTIAASDPTNPRYDRIVAEVRDAAYSGAINDWRLSVVQGVAAAVPAEPAIPADSIELARVTVGAGVTTISGANILDRRALAVGSSSLFLTKAAADAAYLARTDIAHTKTATLETTTSTSLVDLATVGPAAAITVPASGRVLVLLSADVFNSVAGNFNSMGFALSGANTVAAADAVQATNGSTSNGTAMTAAVLVTGLTPGSTTFTAKYRVNGGTGTFYERRITVLPA